jgi:hypothetical protein
MEKVLSEGPGDRGGYAGGSDDPPDKTSFDGFCLRLIGLPGQCFCRTANASVQILGASHRRANLAAIIRSILAPDRNGNKRSLTASVDDTEAACMSPPVPGRLDRRPGRRT